MSIEATQVLGGESLAQVGVNVLRLARERTRPEYLTRRIETAEFVDATTARRSVECHLRLEPFRNVARWPLVAGQLYIPLARLRRNNGSDINFDVTDEAGSVVPTLTRSEERDVVLAGVLQSARQALGSEPKDSTTAVIGYIVFGFDDPDVFERYCHGDDVALVGDTSFQAVLLEAHELAYLIAPLAPGPDYGRRVISYSYDDQPQLQSRERKWLSRLTQPRPVIVADFDVPAVGDCGSYHFELLAPPDLAIPLGCGQLHITKAFSKGPEPPIVEDDRSERRAHFFYDRGGPVERARARAPLQLASTGILFSMRAAIVAAAMLVATATTLAWLRPERAFNDNNIDSWVTVLLAGPAVVTAIIAIRSGHGLTSRMSRDSRLTAAIPAFALYCCAVAVATQPPVFVLRTVWGIGLAATVLGCTRLFNEWRTLRRTKAEKV
jgi:hypothetical protein